MGNMAKIREFLAKNRMTQDELCKRLGLSRDTLVDGDDKKIGLAIKTAFGKGAPIVDDSMEALAPWARKFPVRSLQRQGLIPQNIQGAELVSAIFRFMGVASTDGFNSYYSAVQNTVNPQTYAAWIRLGELRATRSDKEFSINKKMIVDNLLSLRRNTIFKSQEKGYFRTSIKEILNNSGIEFFEVEPFITAPLPICACFWVGNQPVIQVPTNTMNDSQFLEAVFHAVGHILLHPKRTMCLIAPQAAQGENKPANHKHSLPTASNIEKCDEAMRFAQDLLLTEAEECELICNGHFMERRCITHFAGQFHVRPGILVERLQQQGMISLRSPLNDFKQAV